MADGWPSNVDRQYDAGVGFVFPWLNTSSHSVVLNVDTHVVLNGFCRVGADGGILADNLIDMYVKPFLEARLIPGPVLTSDSQIYTQLSADGGGFFGVGEIDEENVAASQSRSVHNFIVPGGRTAVFEAGLDVTARAGGDCSATVDFSSSPDFLVMCPFVLLTFV
jgi:hypothetical protein